MKTALFTFIVGRSSFIELKNAGRLRTVLISIAVWTKTLLYRIITA